MVFYKHEGHSPLPLPGEPTPQERYRKRIRNELYVLASLAAVKAILHFGPTVLDYMGEQWDNEDSARIEQAQELIGIQKEVEVEKQRNLEKRMLQE